MQAGVTMRERGVSAPRPLTIKNIGGVPMARATVAQALANEANDPLTQSKLKELLDYNPETGVFTWKVAPPRKPSFVGKVAGCDSGRGHRIVKINQRIYFMHRLAWLYVYGKWPSSLLDHINRDGCDNRIENLREATFEVNSMNSGLMTGPNRSNKSGIAGVCWLSDRRQWRARIGRDNTLGYFTDFFEACCARKSAENKFWQQN